MTFSFLFICSETNLQQGGRLLLLTRLLESTCQSPPLEDDLSLSRKVVDLKPVSLSRRVYTRMRILPRVREASSKRALPYWAPTSENTKGPCYSNEDTLDLGFFSPSARTSPLSRTSCHWVDRVKTPSLAFSLARIAIA